MIINTVTVNETEVSALDVIRFVFLGIPTMAIVAVFIYMYYFGFNFHYAGEACGTVYWQGELWTKLLDWYGKCN